MVAGKKEKETTSPDRRGVASCRDATTVNEFVETNDAETGGSMKEQK